MPYLRPPMRTKDENKRKAIFAATLKLAGDKGLAGLTVAAIAREAGVAAGTIYLYFAGKEELLNALYRHLKAQTSPADTEALTGLPIREQLALLWEAAIRYRISKPEEIVFLEQFLASGLADAESRQLSDDYRDYIHQLLVHGIRNGVIKDIPVDLLYSLLTGFARDFSRSRTDAGQDISPEEIAGSFALCWDAVAVK